LEGDKKSKRAWFRKGLKDGVPIAMGYLAVAFTLGIAAGNVDISAVQSFFMSLGMVASAGEYAAIILIGSAAGVTEMIATTIIINLRYFLMSCSLSQKLSPKEPMWKRCLLAYCVTDELFGISSAVEGYLEPVYTYGAALISVSGWCLGTVLGVVAGDILPARLSSAMNVALYGMFLAIIIPPVKKSAFMAGLVIISMAASCIFAYTPVLSGISEGFRIIILTVLIAGAAAFIRPVEAGQGKD
jgi:predicted branched-subunit amino acid permease